MYKRQVLTTTSLRHLIRELWTCRLDGLPDFNWQQVRFVCGHPAVDVLSVAKPNDLNHPLIGYCITGCTGYPVPVGGISCFFISESDQNVKVPGV